MSQTQLTARVPNKLTILLTHNCNQKCEFCFDSSQVIDANKNNFIDIEKINKIIQVLKKSNFNSNEFNITLSGGEPTLHPKFFEILSIINKAGFKITILSNGQKFSDKYLVKEIVKNNIWNFQFSIEGSSSNIHDERVGCVGAFNKLLQGIENVKSFGTRYITNTTMSYNSLEDMFKILDLLDTLNVPKVNIGNILPECSGRNRDLVMEYPIVVDIAEKLTLYALTKNLNFSFITPLPICLKKNRVINNPSVCSAGRVSIVVDYDGYMHLCSLSVSANERVINIDEISSIDESYKYMDQKIEKYIIKDLPEECSNCIDQTKCRAACPLYWKVPGVDTPSVWKQIEL